MQLMLCNDGLCMLEHILTLIEHILIEMICYGHNFPLKETLLEMNFAR